MRRIWSCSQSFSHASSSRSGGGAPARCIFHAACCTLHVARCTLYVARCMLHAARCTLHVARCMLHAACCTLHVARCMLHAACCTLHVARCTLHAAVARCVLHVVVWHVVRCSNGDGPTAMRLGATCTRHDKHTRARAHTNPPTRTYAYVHMSCMYVGPHRQTRHDSPTRPGALHTGNRPMRRAQCNLQCDEAKIDGLGFSLSCVRG